jgi:hypothetical protein
MGPIRNHADTVMKVIRSPETAVHFVTLLEEMPVQETLDGVSSLRESGIPIGGVIVNMERPSLLPEADLEAAGGGLLDLEEITRGVKAAGLEQEAGQITRMLAAEAADRALRNALQRRETERLSVLDLPRYELPMLTEGVDLAGLYELAQTLRKQGAA